MKAILDRLEKNKKQTLGRLNIYDGAYLIFSCYTLELPDLQNQKQVSRIPEGHYQVVKRWSKRFGSHFHILNVPNRELILFHRGNFNSDIRGCILVGSALADVNQDGDNDVIYSRETMAKFTGLVKGFNLIIRDEILTTSIVFE